MTKDNDDLNLGEIVADDQKMDAVAHRRKTGEPAVDELGKDAAEIDAEPFAPHDRSNVIDMNKKRKK